MSLSYSLTSLTFPLLSSFHLSLFSSSLLSLVFPHLVIFTPLIHLSLPRTSSHPLLCPLSLHASFLYSRSCHGLPNYSFYPVSRIMLCIQMLCVKSQTCMVEINWKETDKPNPSLFPAGKTYVRETRESDAGLIWFLIVLQVLGPFVQC